MQHWLNTLISPDGEDALSTHPQLRRPLGLLDVTLAQAAALLMPEAGDFTGYDAASTVSLPHSADTTSIDQDATVKEAPVNSADSDAVPCPTRRRWTPNHTPTRRARALRQRQTVQKSAASRPTNSVRESA
jgi:hypothetical protein